MLDKVGHATDWQHDNIQGPGVSGCDLSTSTLSPHPHTCTPHPQPSPTPKHSPVQHSVPGQVVFAVLLVPNGDHLIKGLDLQEKDLGREGRGGEGRGGRSKVTLVNTLATEGQEYCSDSFASTH